MADRDRAVGETRDGGGPQPAQLAQDLTAAREALDPAARIVERWRDRDDEAADAAARVCEAREIIEGVARSLDEMPTASPPPIQEGGHRIRVVVSEGWARTELICPDDGSCVPADVCGDCDRRVGDTERPRCEVCPDEDPDAEDCWLRTWAEGDELSEHMDMQPLGEFAIEATFDGEAPVIRVLGPASQPPVPAGGEGRELREGVDALLRWSEQQRESCWPSDLADAPAEVVNEKRGPCATYGHIVHTLYIDRLRALLRELPAGETGPGGRLTEDERRAIGDFCWGRIDRAALLAVLAAGEGARS